MDQVLKQKWVEALRSGKFEQGSTYFEHNGKFCCLGVLCVVAGESSIIANSIDNGNWNFVNQIIGQKSSRILAGLNDGFDWHEAGTTFPRKTFNEIADYIEENL